VPDPSVFSPGVEKQILAKKTEKSKKMKCKLYLYACEQVQAGASSEVQADKNCDADRVLNELMKVIHGPRIRFPEIHSNSCYDSRNHRKVNKDGV